ncbi:MAG: methyltransferase [Candidatus Hydrogenedentota bacterium]
MEEVPLGRSVYGSFAAAYAARVDTKPHNAYYDRPAVLSLLGEVAGQSVLDCGCGPGVYAEELLRRGAAVTAVDVTPEMVVLARRRLGDGARVIEADISAPMPILRDGEFDAVVCPLVFDYIADLRPVFLELYRVLKADGRIVFSMSDPYNNYRYYKLDSYFETVVKGCYWKGFGDPVYVPCVCRPLSEILNPLSEAGFVLDRIHEPRPTEEFQRANPGEYDQLTRYPVFLCVRARKPL